MASPRTQKHACDRSHYSLHSITKCTEHGISYSCLQTHMRFLTCDRMPQFLARQILTVNTHHLNYRRHQMKREKLGENMWTSYVRERRNRTASLSEWKRYMISGT